ncbi:tetratricopeptide repeat protein [Aliiroseovarius sp. KMU-50]|uniref:Tetratricopeptide repeat protein n=1 Tax=Aliiroseovarius salicola TaxID=3009082 RepID=A0ABT4W0I3_9RHOB|nr:tetratricopeptide repeat protein [Aliiroseovarius sp. KMU-50]MDA5094019.1 tetratricopeptide repeat protein [Aliiroseovarius sp. KMU-50]
MTILALALVITGCQGQTVGPTQKPDSPYAPSGGIRGAESVDGLIVGHRLMSAGEYELALKAYLRSAADHGITVDVLSALGSANLKLGRLGQAERQLRQAVGKDETFVPAWNNLGVVLMEKGEVAEAARVFRLAFGLDSGQSADIRENLRLALARLENPDYDPVNENNFALMRRGQGDFLLLSTL